MNKTNVEEWGWCRFHAFNGTRADAEQCNDCQYIRTQIALAEQRGAEKVIEAIPYELPIQTPQGIQGITLAPIKQSLKDKFLTNTNT